MDVIRLEKAGSTNTWIAGHVAEIGGNAIVIAEEQTGGRGQRGNSWESMPGKNLTFSMLYRAVDFPARCQFSISEAVALSVVDLLRYYGIEAAVKWPNDIYVGDKKICGILIEHAVMSTSIMHSIIGVGLNVNQATFMSDAPNPVSMVNIMGREYPLDELLDKAGDCLTRRLEKVGSEDGRMALHDEFKRKLWRGEGIWKWRDMKNGAGEIFEAEVSDIHPMGFLQLRDMSGALREFAFKEVSPVF